LEKATYECIGVFMGERGKLIPQAERLVTEEGSKGGKHSGRWKRGEKRIQSWAHWGGLLVTVTREKDPEAKLEGGKCCVRSVPVEKELEHEGLRRKKDWKTFYGRPAVVAWAKGKLKKNKVDSS